MSSLFVLYAITCCLGYVMVNIIISIRSQGEELDLRYGR